MRGAQVTPWWPVPEHETLVGRRVRVFAGVEVAGEVEAVGWVGLTVKYPDGGGTFIPWAQVRHVRLLARAGEGSGA